MEPNEIGRFNVGDGWLGITRPELGGNGRQLTPGAGGELPTTHAADGSLSSSPSRVAEEASIGDGAESFFDHLRRHSLLTAWEEVQLAKRIEQGDAEARQRMITANLRLVVSLARRHQHRGEVVLADRIQDGIVGLIVAVDRFDWRRGCRFSTYACWWIRHAIDRGSAGQIDTPIYVREERRRIKAAEPKLEQRLGRSPTEPELAAATGLPLRRVSRLKETDSESEVLSLDAATADHAGTFGDRLSGDSDVYEEVLRVFEGEELRAALTQLPDRSRQVVTLHFGLRGGRPLTFREIGRRLGVSGQRAAQIEQQALEELSARLDASVA